jgi:drug/metabolite transporter (DMT)-like permease
MTSISHASPLDPALRHRAVAWLVFTTLLWGGSFVFTKIGVREFPPLVFLAIRFASAAVLMIALCGTRLRAFYVDLLRRGMMIGTALAAANITFVIGISGTTVSRAGFLNNLFVLIIPLLGFIIWRQRIDLWTLAGVLLATVGLWQLAEGGIDGFNRGDLFSTICAFFISLHIIAVSRLMGSADVRLLTLVQFATVALWGMVALVVVPPPDFHPGPLAIVSLLYCIVFPTVIAFTLQNTWQRYLSPTQAGLLYTLDPVWCLLGGMIFLHEVLSRQEWLGCALLFSAVLLPLLFRLSREQRSAA